MCGFNEDDVVDSFSYESVCKSIEETANGKTFLHNGERFTLSQTIRLTYVKGNVCPKCGLVGDRFQKIKVDSVNNIKDIKHYLILVGKNRKGESIAFTKDHIIPFSFKGANRMINYQPMCEKCNNKKCSNMPDIAYEEVYRMTRVKDTILNHNRGIKTPESVIDDYKMYHEKFLNFMIEEGYEFPLITYDVSEYIKYVKQSGIDMGFKIMDMMERVPKENP